MSFAVAAVGITGGGLAGPAFAETTAGIPPAEAGQTQSIRLIMVETPSCSFCQKWHAEIGPAYPNSREGQFAPLVRAGFDAPELKGLKPVTFTPTFIVLRGNTEVGRLAGYPGRDYFWDEIREILKPAGFGVEQGSPR